MTKIEYAGVTYDSANRCFVGHVRMHDHGTIDSYNCRACLPPNAEHRAIATALLSSARQQMGRSAGFPF